tara:strand:+ start:153 stop:269 length:117 start_codon:yes stop_codon:yes gene_type:complete
MKTFKDYIRERIDDRENRDLERRKEQLKKLAKRYKETK